MFNIRGSERVADALGLCTSPMAFLIVIGAVDAGRLLKAQRSRAAFEVAHATRLRC
jgi:hypothetical protein